MAKIEEIAMTMKEGLLHITVDNIELHEQHIDFVCDLVSDLPVGVYNDELFVMYSKQKDRLLHG